MTHFSLTAIAVVLAWASSALADDTKLPVPPDAAQKEATALIKEVYGEEYSNAKTDEQKKTLGKKLLGKAAESSDKTNRYVILRLARDVAASGGDGQTAFQAIDEMDQLFQIDAMKMKASTLSSMSKKARSKSNRKSIAEQALALVDQAVARDDFELANNLIVLALAQARKARNGDLVKQIAARKKELAEIVKAFAEVKDALAVLEENPTDPDANLIVGKFRCLVKGDWEDGLPMLALGSDAALKALAVKEMGNVSEHAEQVKLGDAWWELAEKDKGRSKAKERAVFWYRNALPRLSGLAKDKVRKRIIATQQSVYLDELEPKEIRIFNNHPFNSLSKRTVGGKVPSHGLLCHPPSSKSSGHIAFSLPTEGFRELAGSVGFYNKRDIRSRSSLTFRVVGDGKLLWKSKPLNTGMTQSFRVDVRGIRHLSLFVDCPGSHVGATAMWIDPVLTD